MDALMSEQSGLRLLFLDTALFDDGATIRGGALITDIETRPYEFRVTGPVKPTQIQRVLYGDTLEEYIHVELIGVPLIKATKERPGLVLLRSSGLLRIRPYVECPVVLVRSDSKLTDDPGKPGEVRPVTISSHREFPAEASAAQSMLAPLMRQRDLLEPFERLFVALTEAHKQHIGEDSVSKARA